eukprot:834411-Pelagomonas_calceolata.AAC.2
MPVWGGASSCSGIVQAKLSSPTRQKNSVFPEILNSVLLLLCCISNPCTIFTVVSATTLVPCYLKPCERCLGKSLIPTAVIKWVEAAGGRPVLIRYYSSEGELRRLFQQVNGLVLPVSGVGNCIWQVGKRSRPCVAISAIQDGPGYELMDDSYMKAARSLFELAVQANDAGDPFPLTHYKSQQGHMHLVPCPAGKTFSCFHGA